MLDLLAIIAWYAGGVGVEHIRPVLFPTEVALQQYSDRYLQGIAQQGFPITDQGVWVQTAHHLLIDHQGDRPLPAASSCCKLKSIPQAARGEIRFSTPKPEPLMS